MIDDTFLKLKSNLELSTTFQQTITRQQEAVRSVVEKKLGPLIKTKLIGSVIRQTRIQPLPGAEFDIDILVEMGSFNCWLPASDPGGITTTKAMDRLFSAIDNTDRYSSKGPVQDHPTVSFSYADGVAVELVPAYVDDIGISSDGAQHAPKSRAYWIPTGTGNWELADYDFERDAIVKANSDCGGWLVPVVKMLKAVKREHFPSMKSWHLEVITAEMLPTILSQAKQNGHSITYPLLVAASLYHLQDHIAGSHKIPESLSPPFMVSADAQYEIRARDQWLRRMASDAYRASTEAEKHRLWKQIFKDVLPLP